MNDARKRITGAQNSRPTIEGLEVRCLLSASIEHQGVLYGTGAENRTIEPKAHPAGPSGPHKVDVPKPAHVKKPAKKPVKKHPIVDVNLPDLVTGSIMRVNAEGAVKAIIVSTAGASGHTLLTFRVTSATIILADGHAAALGSLNAGTVVTIQRSKTSLTTAAAITAINHQAAGTIASFDVVDRILTLATAGGGSAIYSVNAQAAITIDGETSPLSAIAIGLDVDLTLSVFNNSDIITLAAGKPKGAGGEKKD